MERGPVLVLLARRPARFDACRFVVCLALGLLAFGCASSAPILLKPTLLDTRFTCPLPGQTVTLTSVVDRRGHADASNVGFTQTGLANVQASLLTQPAPRELVRQRLRNVLRECPNASAVPQPVALEVFITRFQTTETTGFVTERIVAEITLQARIKSANGAALGAF